MGYKNTQQDIARWTEIQFYMAMRDIWCIRKDFKDILRYITALKIWEPTLDISKVCSIAQHGLINNRLKMNREEFIIMAWKFDIPNRIIQKYTHCYVKTIYEYVKRYLINPNEYYFYPRESAKIHEHMKLTLQAITKSQEVGITWTTKFIKRYGTALKLRELKHSQ